VVSGEAEERGCILTTDDLIVQFPADTHVGKHVFYAEEHPYLPQCRCADDR